MTFNTFLAVFTTWLLCVLVFRASHYSKHCMEDVALLGAGKSFMPNPLSAKSLKFLLGTWISIYCYPLPRCNVSAKWLVTFSLQTAGREKKPRSSSMNPKASISRRNNSSRTIVIWSWHFLKSRTDRILHCLMDPNACANLRPLEILAPLFVVVSKFNCRHENRRSSAKDCLGNYIFN